MLTDNIFFLFLPLIIQRSRRRSDVYSMEPTRRRLDHRKWRRQRQNLERHRKQRLQIREFNNRSIIYHSYMDATGYALAGNRLAFNTKLLFWISTLHFSKPPTFSRERDKQRAMYLACTKFYSLFLSFIRQLILKFQANSRQLFIMF